MTEREKAIATEAAMRVLMDFQLRPETKQEPWREHLKEGETWEIAHYIRGLTDMKVAKAILRDAVE